MAHTCPECGMLCHCGGDIDDLDFGEAMRCNHYIECQKNEEDFDYYEDMRTPYPMGPEKKP